MNELIANRVGDCIRYVLLRGSGWRPRKRREGTHYLTEWLDPFSGHWYGARKALEILQHQMLADDPARRASRRPYSLRC